MMGLRCSCVFGVSRGMALILCEYSLPESSTWQGRRFGLCLLLKLCDTLTRVLERSQASVVKQLPSKYGWLTCFETIEMLCYC